MIRFFKRHAAALVASFLVSLPAGATNFGTDYTDLWWNPSESGWGVNLIQDFVQKQIHGKMAKPFEQILGTPMRESRTEVLLRYAEGYLDPSFQAGEAIVAVGIFPIFFCISLANFWTK